MADEGEVGEQPGFFDGVEGSGWVEAAKEGEVDDGGFGVIRIGAGGGIDAGEADDGGFAHAVIDENFIAFFHIPDGLNGLCVVDPVPYGCFVVFKVGEAVGVRIGFGEVELRTGHAELILNVWGQKVNRTD